MGVSGLVVSVVSSETEVDKISDDKEVVVGLGVGVGVCVGDCGGVEGDDGISDDPDDADDSVNIVEVDTLGVVLGLGVGVGLGVGEFVSVNEETGRMLAVPVSDVSGFHVLVKSSHSKTCLACIHCGIQLATAKLGSRATKTVEDLIVPGEAL